MRKKLRISMMQQKKKQMFQTLNLKFSIMASNTITIATIKGKTSKDATLLVEHHRALLELDERGLQVSIDLERCGILGFFLEPQTIHPELVRMFLRKAMLNANNFINSKVLEKEVIVNQVNISEAIQCHRLPICFQN